MDIRVLASGSSGNAYYVGGKTPLLLEAGIPFRLIQQGLNFEVSQLAGVLVSHEHMDHAKAANDVMRSGVDCYMSQGTAEALSLSGHRVHIIKARNQFQIGAWTIMPFETIHDAAEPLGFLMAQGKVKILFAIDTEYIPYRFPGLTHILIGVNYSMEIVKSRLKSGELNSGLWRRIIKSHMSLETLLDFLKANDLSQVRQIYLLHLSDNNSDAKLFKLKVQEVTGKEVIV